ncbi:uncharacterized protein LOC102706729 [Oryza brachyantha]|uniref:DUF4408 domain-containing protein n=1 Tax=Oryza brachyantha TaxID=4533 RepID=J3LFF6_ORYBR|nr:uncharacterized protein LOC102706729 [Oryza brachyantha]
MAAVDAAAASPSTQAIRVVVANGKRASSALVPVAVLLAVAVGAVSLLPSLAQAVWEVPHLFLLGVVISYGVFAQKNSAGGDGGDGGGGGGDGARAWNSRYLADDPLVVVAATDNAESDDDGACGGKPLSLPVRRLKPPPPPPAPALEAEAGGDASDDDGIGADTDSSASTAGFWGAGPSPPSVLDAVCRSRKSTAATTDQPSTTSKGFPDYGSPVPPGDHSFSDDGQVTDWDDDDDDADDMGASTQRTTSYHDDYNGDFANDDGGDMSVDEELSELAAKAAPDQVEDEVDRKADEFIAKFREQIRLQRL